jgi:hypothetical protein
MTQQIINIGAAPNDGEGDNLRTAFDKVNDNFSNVWAQGPVDSNVRIQGNTISTLQVNQDLALSPNGTGNIRLNNNTIPGANNTWFLGSTTNRWRGLYVGNVTANNLSVSGIADLSGDVTVGGNLTVVGNTIQIGNITTDTKTIQLANTATTDSAANGSGVTVGANDDIATFLYDSGNNVWTTNIGLQVGGPVTGTSLAVSSATVYGNIAAINGNFTGNVTANYFFGNGSQLTGIGATIANTAPTMSAGGIWWNSVDGRAYVKYGNIFIDLSPSLVPDPTTYVGNVSFDDITVTNVGNIIPAGNNAYSLGTEAFQWKDLWVSNNTIYINSVPITLSADNVLTVDGNAVLQNDSNTSITTTGTVTAETLTANTSVLIGTGAIGIAEDNFLVVETLVPGGLRPSNDDMYLLGNTIHRWSEVHANVYYGDGSQLTGISGGGDSLVNGNNSFVLDADGNVVFEGTGIGDGVNRGLVWDYGAVANGVNSQVRQDNDGLTVRAYTVAGGGANGYSAPVNITTGQDDNEKYWVFDGQGNLTLPGNIQSVNTGGFTFSETITNIESFAYPTPPVITIAEEIFGAPITGQVTISNLNPSTGALQANGTWYYEAVDPNQFTLYTDAALTEPVDTSSWTAYLGPGGNAVSLGAYTDLTIQGGNVTVGSNNNTWTFGSNGNLNLPLGGVVSEGASPSGLGSTIALTPSGGSDADQQLLIYPTGNVIEGNHLHLTTGNLLNTELYLGNDDFYVKLADTGNIIVNTAGNTAQWTFDTDGSLTLPGANADYTIATQGGYITVGNLLIGQGGSLFNSNNDSWALYGNISDPGTSISIPSDAAAGNGTPLVLENQISNVEIRSGFGTWTFGNTGVLTLPNADATGFGNIYFEQNSSTITFGLDDNATPFLYSFSTLGITLPRGGATIRDTVGNALAFGRDAAATGPQGNAAVAIGQQAGDTSQGANAVAIGYQAGLNTQGVYSVAIGSSAGAANQGVNSVAIGTQAGQITQGQFAVAIGDNAGNNAQGTDAVAIGASAGLNTQGAGAVAFGQGTGETSQGANAVALGKAAGQVNQGINSVAIGQSAGLTNQGNNTIILNATGSALDQTTANTFTVAPVRNDVANVAEILFYNTTSKEITYGNTISVAGNIIGANLFTSGNIVTSGSGGAITMTGGNITGAGNISAGNLIATGNIVLTGSLVGSGASPAPSLSGFSSVSAVTLSASGNVTAGNVSATGNVTAANFFGNGATLSNVATQVTGSWTVPVGNSTQSFTVTPNETYYLWVDCNIPNGILAWNATATVTNTNVPVVGAQYAWVYTGNGTPIDFTSIPNQFTGTANTIVRSSVAPSATTNRFDFGINNASGNAVTVNYGYTKIS